MLWGERPILMQDLFIRWKDDGCSSVSADRLSQLKAPELKEEHLYSAFSPPRFALPLPSSVACRSDQFFFGPYLFLSNWWFMGGPFYDIGFLGEKLTFSLDRTCSFLIPCLLPFLDQFAIGPYLTFLMLLLILCLSASFLLCLHYSRFFRSLQFAFCQNITIIFCLKRRFCVL